MLSVDHYKLRSTRKRIVEAMALLILIIQTKFRAKLINLNFTCFRHHRLVEFFKSLTLRLITKQGVVLLKGRALRGIRPKKVSSGFEEGVAEREIEGLHLDVQLRQKLHFAVETWRSRSPVAWLADKQCWSTDQSSSTTTFLFSSLRMMRRYLRQVI